MCTRERSDNMGMRQVFSACFAVLVVLCVLACVSSSPAPPQVATSTVGDVSDGRAVGVADLLVVLEGVASGASVGTGEDHVVARHDKAALLGVLGCYGTGFGCFIAAMEHHADSFMDGIEPSAGSFMLPRTAFMDAIESAAGSFMMHGTTFKFWPAYWPVRNKPCPRICVIPRRI